MTPSEDQPDVGDRAGKVISMASIISERMRGRADLHTHTKYSGVSRVMFLDLPDSVAEPVEMVEAAERRGLDVLCVTDHNSVKGAVEAKKYARSVEIVIGEEILTSEGEILGLFLTEEIPRGLSASETIDLVHGQGGIAVAAHPFSTHCSALGDKIFQLPLDAVEVFNAFHRDRYSNDLAFQKCSASDLCLVAGSDAHSPMTVGDAYTAFEGTSSEELRKAILNKQTDYGGMHTSFRNVVWMTTLLVLRLQKAVGRALLNLENTNDAEWANAVFSMRRTTKLVSFAASFIFLMPPITFSASLVGDRLHTSRSRSNWLSRREGRK
jgi:predicted metal-dependent phosphoesterase TrpH